MENEKKLIGLSLLLICGLIGFVVALFIQKSAELLGVTHVTYFDLGALYLFCMFVSCLLGVYVFINFID